MSKILNIAGLTLGFAILASSTRADSIKTVQGDPPVFTEHAISVLRAAGDGDHYISGRSGSDFFGAINPKNSFEGYRGSSTREFINAFDASCNGGNPGPGGGHAVPDGASTVMLLGLSTLGLVALRRRPVKQTQ
jgi:hypothetical protein